MIGSRTAQATKAPESPPEMSPPPPNDRPPQRPPATAPQAPPVPVRPSYPPGPNAPANPMAARVPAPTLPAVQQPAAGPRHKTGNAPVIPPIQQSRTLPLTPMTSPNTAAPAAARGPSMPQAGSPTGVARQAGPAGSPAAQGQAPATPQPAPAPQRTASAYAKTDVSPRRTPSVRPPPLAGPVRDHPITPPLVEPERRQPSQAPGAPGVETHPPRSTRPTAAWDLQATNESPSLADTFASLLNDVDASFGSLQMKKGDSQRPDLKDAGRLESVGLSDVRELFEQLAANHMRQVRDFMIDVKWGEAMRAWVGVCEPAVRSLRRAAEKLDLTELCRALDDYHAALEGAGRGTERTIQGDAKNLLVASYDRLLELMPQAFALDSDRTQREMVIVQSLLLQVPYVRKVTIDKLYAAGLASLEVMFSARADDIAQTTGIPLTLAERIVEKVQLYRKELSAVVPDATRSAERSRLAALAKELKRQHVEYEQAAASWSEEAAAKKRYLRQARDETLLQVKVLLARLGEVERLSVIERVPFRKKVENIEAFLDEAIDKYVPA